MTQDVVDDEIEEVWGERVALHDPRGWSDVVGCDAASATSEKTLVLQRADDKADDRLRDGVEAEGGRQALAIHAVESATEIDEERVQR